MAKTALSGRRVGKALAQVAIGYLDNADSACHRLSDPQDSEALHDFRVALRRLHSCLDAYPAIVSPVLSKRRLKRLRRLAKATNAARDAEVQIQWLNEQSELCLQPPVPACARLLTELQRRSCAGGGAPAQSLPARFNRLQRKLRKRLARLADSTEGVEFGLSTARVALPLIRALRQGLSAISGADDEAAAHAVRITAKRLRYLLTPLRAEYDACDRAVTALGELQDLLGELHDRHLFIPLLGQVAAAASADRARRLFTLDSPVPGALAWAPAEAEGFVQLFQRNRAKAESLYDHLREHWLLDLPTFEAGLLAAVNALERGDVERRRR